MNWETILCLGDSITIGSRSYMGYPEYCGNYLKKKTKKEWNVINCSVAGFKVIDLIRHIDLNWLNIKGSSPLLASIMIGTNDLKSGTSIEDFKIAFDLLVLKAKLLVGSKHIVLNKIPTLQKGVMLPYNSGMNKTAILYNNFIEEFAQQEGLILNTMPESEDLFLDGVHLNAKGSKEWGVNLGNLILELRNAN